MKMVIALEVYQWFKNGDHPEDKCETFYATGELGDGLAKGTPFQGEGKVVRYYRHPKIDGKETCARCGVIMHEHGWLDPARGGSGETVCPSDWIMQDENDKYFRITNKLLMEKMAKFEVKQ